MIGGLWLATLGHSRSFHVSSGGQGPAGTSTNSMTLPAASMAAMPGDTVWLHEGNYRETLVPARSGAPGAPIVYCGAPGESVILTGLDTLVGWTPGGGGIWQAPAPKEVRQLFQDRRPMPEARYPNSGRDLFHPATIPLNMTDTELTSASLPPLDDRWAGATVWALVGLRWISQNATVSYASSAKLTLVDNSYPDNQGDGIGYLSGVLAALDTAGEWFWRDDSIHFIPDSGRNPAQATIEGKTRTWAVDLSGKTDIVVKDLQVFAGAANLNRSRRCRLEGLKMRYLSHFISPVGGKYTSAWTRWKGISISAPGIGVGVFGDSNSVIGCDIQWSAGDGITIYGNGNLVQDNLISKTDYAGPDMNGISLYGSDNRITRNTVDSCGRGCIFLFGGGKERVDHNLVAHAGMVDWDIGGIYMYGVDGQGTSIDHNWVHDIHSDDQYKLGMGIYIDNFNSNVSVHHNVIWQCDFNALNYSRPAVNITWANNTVFQAGDVTTSYLHPSATVDSSRSNRLWNNLMTTRYGTGKVFSALEQSHNLRLSSLPLRDPANFDFRLQEGALAIDSGLSIPGIDDPIVGRAPDVGAYESGGVFWKAGAGSVDSGGDTRIREKSLGAANAWRRFGSNILAVGACDLTVFDLAGARIEQFHLEAGQWHFLSPRSGMVVVSGGRRRELVNFWR